MASNGLLSINESGLKNAKGILDSANTNLANARDQLTRITMPEKFSYSARLKTVSSSIQQVEKQVSGIQSYIDQKIEDFRRAEENAKNVANALGKSLAGLTMTGFTTTEKPKKVSDTVLRVQNMMNEAEIGGRFEIKDGKIITQYPGRDGIVTIREKNIVDKKANNQNPYKQTASKVSENKTKETNKTQEPIIAQWFNWAKSKVDNFDINKAAKTAKDTIEGAVQGLDEKTKEVLDKIRNFDLKETAATIRNMNGSDLMNLLIAGGKGAAKVGEEVADAYQIMATNSFSQNPDALYYYRDNMKEIEKGQKMLQRDTMAMVSVQHVDTAYNDFYNTDFGKSLAENAQENFKPGGKYTNWVETRAHQATIFTVGGALGGTLGAGVLGGMAAKGKTAEAMWVNNDVKSLIDNGASIDTLDDIYKKADTYSSIMGMYVGASMAFQKATGSGGKIDKVLNNPIKRMFGDAVAGSTEPIVNAYAESKVTGASFTETFEKNGGWNAVGAAFTGAAFDSMVGEIKGYVKGRITQEMKAAVKDAVDDLIHPKDRIVADPGLFDIFDNIGNSIRSLFKRNNSDNSNDLNESQSTKQAIENKALELSKKFGEEAEQTTFLFGFRGNHLERLQKEVEEYNTYSTIRLRGKQDGTVEVYPWEVEDDEIQQTMDNAYMQMSKKMILEGKNEEEAFSQVLESLKKINENSKNNLLEREIAPYYGTPEFISERSNYIIKCMDTILNDDSASSDLKKDTALIIDDARKIADDIGSIGQSILTQRDYEEYDRMKASFEKLLSYEDKLSEGVRKEWSQYLTDPKDYREGEHFAFFVHAFGENINELKPSEKLCCTLVTEKCMPIPYGDYGVIADVNSGSIVTMCTEDAGSWPISKEEFINRGLITGWQFAERSGDDGDRVFFEFPKVSKLILPSTMEREMIKNNQKYEDGRCESYSEIYMTKGNNGENINIQELFYIDENGKRKTKPISDGFNPIKLDPTKGTVVRRTTKK